MKTLQEQLNELADPIVKAPTTNVLKRPAWKPPKPFDPRDGAQDFKEWPSKGGD